ncbi:MAG: hypothetical protein LBF36_03085 [Mycoplasmataceae bacterium]|nr:hypothetical protein [Mycoplasmataceae bacterium]
MLISFGILTIFTIIGITIGRGTIIDLGARAMSEQPTIANAINKYDKLTWVCVVIYASISTLFLICFLSIKGKYKKSISITSILITCFISVLVSLCPFFLFSISHPKGFIGIFAVAAMHPEFAEQAFNQFIYNTTFKIIFSITIVLPILMSILVCYYSPRFTNTSKVFKLILTALIIVSIVVIISISLDVSTGLHTQINN